MRHKRRGRKAAEGLFFGFILVLVGSVFMMDRLGMIDMGDFWEWWPLIPIAMGLVRIAGWDSAESVASGIGWTLFGCWFLVNQMGWFGLDWHNSWPIVLVAIGLSMVVRTLLEPLFRDRPEKDESQGGESHA